MLQLHTLSACVFSCPMWHPFVYYRRLNGAEALFATDPQPSCTAGAGPSGGALPPFYLFPTGNAFHGSCLAAEVAALSTPANMKRIQGLAQRLAQVGQS